MLDIIEAELDNDMLAQGQPVPPPMPWHMHPVHIARHRRFTMSDKFRQLPPPIQGLTLEHMMLHNEFMAAAQMQLRPGQAAPAGPAGGSKGSAKGDQAGSEKEVLQREAQNASPDTFSG